MFCSQAQKQSPWILKMLLIFTITRFTSILEWHGRRIHKKSTRNMRQGAAKRLGFDRLGTRTHFRRQVFYQNHERSIKLQESRKSKLSAHRRSMLVSHDKSLSSSRQKEFNFIFREITYVVIACTPHNAPLYIAFATLLRTFHRRISSLTHKILKVEREINSHIARSPENLLPSMRTIY